MVNEKKRAYDKQYNQEHKERYRTYGRQYYQEHKEESKAHSKKYFQLHEEEQKAYFRHYEQEHREEFRAYNKQYYLRVKTEVLTHYGNGRCACIRCSFDDLRALSIDHINGGGIQHRRNLGNLVKGNNFYLWLKREGYPEGYQTLCMNCQFLKK